LFTIHHLSSLTGAKHGFKPMYNAVEKIGRFTFIVGHLFSKVAEIHFLLFYGI